MIKVAIPTCLLIALAFLSASAAAESIEAARAAFSKGEYIAAADLGEALGTSEGHALAAEVLAIYAHYLAKEEEKEPLLQRAMRAAEAAIELHPANAEAHLQSAHATGRYSQLFAPMKAMREGYPKQVRALIERALELNPSHFGAHLSLASWHAEAIGRGGMMARALLGAKKKERVDPLRAGPGACARQERGTPRIRVGPAVARRQEAPGAGAGFARARDLIAAPGRVPAHPSSTGHRAVGGSRRRGDIPIGAVSYRNATVYQK